MSANKHILVFSFTHHNLSIQELQSFIPERSDAQWLEGQLANQFDELVTLSTCNRLEIFATVDSIAEAIETFCQAHSMVTPYTPGQIRDKVMLFTDDEAVPHLFRLVSGLDSMVPGDAQILGQVKQGYNQAQQANRVGRTFHPLFQRAFSVAKRVRHETGLGKGRLSISALAVEYAQEFFFSLFGSKAVVIGAGKMGRLAARYLNKAGAREICVVNRSYEPAHELAQEVHGEAYTLDELPRALADADVVISSTASPDYVIDRQVLAASGPSNGKRLLIDIALPHDIDPAVVEIEGVHRVELENLRSRAEANKTARAAEFERATCIVQDECEQFGSLELSLNLDQLANELGQQAEQIFADEFAQLMENLNGLSDEQRQAIEHRMRRLAERIILTPRRNLRQNPLVRECPEALQCLVETFHKPSGARSDSGRSDCLHARNN